LLPLFLVAVLVAAPLTGPSGLDGAGLGMDPAAKWRVYGDVNGHGRDWRSFSPTLGAGFRARPGLEVEVQVPAGFESWWWGTDAGLGNVTLGIHALQTDRLLRWTAGGTVSLPTSRLGGAILGAFNEAFRRMDLRFPYWAVVSAPVHLETGRTVVGTLDSSVQAFFGPWGWESGAWEYGDIVTVVTPGVAGRLPADTLLGVRASWVQVWTRDDPYDDQYAVEPWLRHDFGSRAFASAAVTLPLRGYLDGTSWWGWTLGGGATF